MVFDEVLIAGNDCPVNILAQEKQRDSNGNIVYNSSNQPVMQPINLTGASIKWILKKHVRDTSYLVFKSTSNGGISISNPTAGLFTVNLSAADTQGYDGDYYCEAEVTDAAGHVSTLKKDDVNPGWILKINPNAISKSGM